VKSRQSRDFFISDNDPSLLVGVGGDEKRAAKLRDRTKFDAPILGITSEASNP
jgi:hypothetical protein